MRRASPAPSLTPKTKNPPRAFAREHAVRAEDQHSEESFRFLCWKVLQSVSVAMEFDVSEQPNLKHRFTSPGYLPVCKSFSEGITLKGRLTFLLM